jgi:general secretion pathway protein N
MPSTLQAATDSAFLSRLKPLPVRSSSHRRLVLAGLVIGTLMAVLLHAPASWLARWVASTSSGHVLLVDTRGSVWSGSGDFVLTGGAGSRDAVRLPGRLNWQLGLAGRALELRLQMACCIAGEVALRLQPGWGSFVLSLPARTEPLARLPAAWLEGLGTPWNTLQLGGQLRLSSRDFQLAWHAGRWLTRGTLEVDFTNLSSRISTLSPLGTYRLTLQSQADGLAQLTLSTLEGALQLQGQGTVGGNTKARFLGEARAAPGREAALNNLLNIIGRRQGERSVISFG